VEQHGDHDEGRSDYGRAQRHKVIDNALFDGVAEKGPSGCSTTGSGRTANGPPPSLVQFRNIYIKEQ